MESFHPLKNWRLRIFSPSSGLKRGSQRKHTGYLLLLFYNMFLRLTLLNHAVFNTNDGDKNRSGLARRRNTFHVGNQHSNSIRGKEWPTLNVVDGAKNVSLGKQLYWCLEMSATWKIYFKFVFCKSICFSSKRAAGSEFRTKFFLLNIKMLNMLKFFIHIGV